MMLFNGNRDVRVWGVCVSKFLLTIVQEGFTYLMTSREEKLLSSIRERLQQAAMDNHDRRKLLLEIQSHFDSQRLLVNRICVHIWWIFLRCHYINRKSIMTIILRPEIEFLLVYVLCASSYN